MHVARRLLDVNLDMAMQAVLEEFRPAGTLEYARAIYKSSVVPSHIAVRHGQLFVTEQWRVRREVLDEESLHAIDHHDGYSAAHNVDREQLRQGLLRRLAPAAQKAVRVLLQYPALLT